MGTFMTPMPASKTAAELARVSSATRLAATASARFVSHPHPPCMREVVFRILVERTGHLEAQAHNLPIQITAPTHEDLQHEAREALITHVGPAHCGYPIRICRSPVLMGTTR